jgi:hypothetical protein
VGRGRGVIAGIVALLVPAVAAACGTSAPPTFASRHVHLSLHTAEKVPGGSQDYPDSPDDHLGWQLSNADGSVEQTTSTDAGFDFHAPDESDDYWLSAGFPEHYDGVWNDSDGLQRTGSGIGPCRTGECIHIFVAPDGSIQLPNRGNEKVTSVFVEFYAPFHDDGPDRSNLPDDARPNPHAKVTSPPST